MQQVRNILKQAFPEGMIADYRETHPIITRGLERSTTFLSLISLIALIVGALGVATAMHAHLKQKMDTIAVLKCLGARSSQVLRIYLAQTLALGLAGGLLGVAFGTVVQRIFPALIGRFFPVQPQMGLDLVPAAQGLAIGILTTLLFTLPTLLGIREIRPAVIFRREMAEAELGLAEALEPFAAGAGNGRRHPGRHRADRGVAIRRRAARIAAHRRVFCRAASL